MYSMHRHKYNHICTHVPTYTHTYVHTHMTTHIHANLHTQTFTHAALKRKYSTQMHTFTYFTLGHSHIHIQMYTDKVEETHTHTHTNTHIHTHTHTNTHTCMYTNTCIHNINVQVHTVLLTPSCDGVIQQPLSLVDMKYNDSHSKDVNSFTQHPEE